jgi:hypothetical protein
VLKGPGLRRFRRRNSPTPEMKKSWGSITVLIPKGFVAKNDKKLAILTQNICSNNAQNNPSCWFSEIF